jgi:tripartite-type tricarboxylate transporter receptor subunit TctC
MLARLFVVAFLLCGFAAEAATVEEFYRGSTLRIITSAGPSSGYTLWAHFIAQFLPRHIPGNPQIIVQSMGGAGGIIAINHMYNAAARDGREIGAVGREVAVLSMMGHEGARYDSLKFNWLGTPTSESNICIARSDSPIRSVEDLFRQEFLVGTDGVGSGMHIFPVALNALLGMKFKPIDGYADTGVVLLAVDRGEVYGSCQSAETLMQARGEAIRSGKLKVVLQAGLHPNPDFPDAPFVFDLAQTEEQRQALRFLYASLAFGRPYLAPPGVPPERVAALRQAFSETFKDPDFLRGAKIQGYQVDPISGEEMSAMMQELSQTPKPVIDQIARLFEPPKN